MSAPISYSAIGSTGEIILKEHGYVYIFGFLQKDDPMFLEDLCRVITEKILPFFRGEQGQAGFSLSDIKEIKAGESVLTKEALIGCVQLWVDMCSEVLSDLLKQQGDSEEIGAWKKEIEMTKATLCELREGFFGSPELVADAPKPPKPRW